MRHRNCLKTCRKTGCALKLIFNCINFVFRRSGCRATWTLVHLFLISTKWQQNLWYIAALLLFMHWVWTKTLLMKKQSNPFPQLIQSTCPMVRISSSLLLYVAFRLPCPQLLFHFAPITVSSVFYSYFMYHAIPTWFSTSNCSARGNLQSMVATSTTSCSEAWHTTTALKITLQAYSEHWNDSHRTLDVPDYLQ